MEAIGLVPVGEESAPSYGRHIRQTRDRGRMLRIKRQRSEALCSQDRGIESLCGGRRWRAARCSVGRGDAGYRRHGLVAGGWPVGKKPVIRLLGLNGGGDDGSIGRGRLLDGSVDSEKVAGERDVVRGRHCARVVVVE